MPIRAVHSTAPDADALIGRATGDLVRSLLPIITRSLLKIEASVRGARWLAANDRAFDVAVDGGERLRAFDALSGRFMIHFGSNHVAFPTEGHEEDTIVRTHPHAPDAPIGFYNAPAAKRALTEIARVLDAAIAAEDSTPIDRLRAEHARDRVGLALARTGELERAAARYPILARFQDAAVLAHDVRRPGDCASAALARLRGQIEEWRDANRSSVSPRVLAAVERDLQIVGDDEKKWLAYHAPRSPR